MLKGLSERASVSERWTGDLWGGFAATLVALPSAIAFGVTIFSPLGGVYPAYGALAGILGVTALGIVASAMGGTDRLITAPCAPAAAVMSAFAADLVHRGVGAESVVPLLIVIAVLSGALQLIYGAAGLGRLIKYMPFPVVTGYMTGVGLIIIGSQIPKLLGSPSGVPVWRAVLTPSGWRWQSIAVGAATAAVMLAAPRVTRRVPAPILALGAGVLAYFCLAALDASLMKAEGNSLVIGPMITVLGNQGGGFVTGFLGRVRSVMTLTFDDVASVMVPALTLSVLLSIDTLKTCVVLDAMTHSRHNSNRELIGQGLGNLASAFIGGVPGAGQMGATLVNLSSGGRSRLSGTFEGAMALFTFVLLGRFISWVPLAALAAILIVVGARMIDRRMLALVRSRDTILDFVVILTVVMVALFVGLIPASGAGIALAILLFVREQLKTSILRRKIYGNESLSRRPRPEWETEMLRARGGQAAILELQGSLFFGTADQLHAVLEPEIKARKYIVLDMHRVQTIDFTVAHVLEQTRDIMAEKNGFLVYSRLPTHLPSGRNLDAYVDRTGIAPYKSAARVFDDLDEAKAWIEGRILKDAAGTLKEAPLADDPETALQLNELDLFKGRKQETLDALDTHLEKVSFVKGTRLFSRGEDGAHLFFVRRGLVALMLPVGQTRSRRINTCGRGSFFGEAGFLDGAAHTTDAIALTDVEVFILSRANFDAFAESHKKAAFSLMAGLASIVADRVRFLTDELVATET